MNMDHKSSENVPSAVNQQERLNENATWIRERVAQLQEEYDALRDNLEQKSKRGEEISEEEQRELGEIHGELIDSSNTLHGIESQIEMEKRKL